MLLNSRFLNQKHWLQNFLFTGLMVHVQKCSLPSMQKVLSTIDRVLGVADSVLVANLQIPKPSLVSLHAVVDHP